MQRVMCIWFPHWPVQRWRCGWTASGRVPGRRPLLLYKLRGQRGPLITACSRQARQVGVQTGMPLAEARALLQPHVRQWGLPQITAHDPVADRQALRRLARRFQRFSPLIGLEETPTPECLLIDLTGCAHLFGGEQSLAGQIICELYSQGLFARIATADTIGAAWAISHFGTTLSARVLSARKSSARKSSHNRSRPAGPPTRRRAQQRHLTVAAIVEAGRHRELLPLLSVEALRLPERIVTTLRELGLRTIGQLQRLPRESLPSRFGQVLLQRLDQATGDATEVLTPERWRAPIRRQWVTDHPTSDRRVLQHALGQLAEEVAAELQMRQEGVLALHGTFHCESGHRVPLHIGLAQPSQAAPHLRELINIQVERLTLSEPVLSVTLAAQQTTSWEQRQRSLFEEGTHEESQRQLAQLIDRLGNRLGAEAVLRADLLPDVQPEFAVRYTPLVTSPETSPETPPNTATAAQADPTASAVSKSAHSGTSGQEQPLQDEEHSDGIQAEQLEQQTIGGEHVPPRPVLLDPTPSLIQVRVDGESGRPHTFRWKSRTLTIGRCWGPERIETGWWRAEPIERDYFHVETTDGQHLWLFRRLKDGRWFLHGAFD